MVISRLFGMLSSSGIEMRSLSARPTVSNDGPRVDPCQIERKRLESCCTFVNPGGADETTVTHCAFGAARGLRRRRHRTGLRGPRGQVGSHAAAAVHARDKLRLR